MKEVNNNSSSYYYHTNYIRSSGAITWAIFTICFAIILIVVFVQPYWIGDSAKAKGVGYVGLYHMCVSFGLREEPECTRKIFDFSQIGGNSALAAATVFVGLGVIFVLLSVFGMCCFMCRQPTTTTVFRICGVLQLSTGIFVLIGTIIYPAGWDHNIIQDLCGGGSYSLGGCQLRWAFVLAILAVFDAFILGSIALLLSRKHDKPHPEHLEDCASQPEILSEYSSRASKFLRNFKVNPLPVEESNDDERNNGGVSSPSHRGPSPENEPAFRKRNNSGTKGSSAWQ